MKIYSYLQGLILMTVCTSSLKSDKTHNLPANLELQMVNILFRHGDRTPDNSDDETYPNDPFVNETYYPIGHGKLTKKGKTRAFLLGKFLRKEYDELLGSTYIPEDVSARSTHFDRTKMTLLIVLSGLYPTHWRTIPIKYEIAEKDFLLMPTGCPKFKKMVAEIEKLPDVKKQAAKFKSLWKMLSILSGKRINRSRNAFDLYNQLVAQKSMNLRIPDWAEEILHNKEFLESIKLDIYIRNYNETVEKLNGGRLLKKINNGMIAKVKGTSRKKIILISAHDINVSALLFLLGLKKPHQPYYTSAVILELYRDKNETHYVQIVYYRGSLLKKKILNILKCSQNIYDMCEFNEYLELIKKVIPNDDEELECCDNGLEKCSLTW